MKFHEYKKKTRVSITSRILITLIDRLIERACVRYRFDIVPRYCR